MQKYSYKKFGIFAAVVLITVTAICILIGCGSAPGITLATDKIELYVGEIRDIFPYVNFSPTTADNKNIRLLTDCDCVEISGSTVKAIKSGTAEITVESNGGDAVLSVTVVYRDVSEITLYADENAVQTVPSGQKPKPVVLTADIGLSDPKLPIVWTADGIKFDENTTVVNFVPQGYGEFEICAEAAGIKSVTLVRVYKNSNITATSEGTLEGFGMRPNVRFYAKEQIDPDNPPSVFEWFVNGEYSGNLPIFEFSPDAEGRYDVSLKANGSEVKIDGKQFVSVIAEGKFLPDCRVEFDDKDGISVVWDDGAYAVRVSIVSQSDGTRRDIDRSDAQYAYMFGSGYFDVSEFIDVCAEEPATYRIYVKTDGIGECSFTQYPLSVKEFITAKPFIKNMFISSTDDGIELIEDLYACGILEARAYSVVSEDEINGIVDYAHSVLGAELNVSREGNIVMFVFAGIVNKPEYREELPNVLRMYSELPHIEYDATLRRQSGYVFESDRIKRTVEVAGSEQLFLAVKRGYRPLPKEGSTAELIYGTAKNRLSNIIGANYDGEQKIHAVYDWIQWVSILGNYNEKSSVNYLESFFGSVEIGLGDVRRAVVSKYGASKIFAFLCGIEGIECEIITDGYDYRNKVKLNGMYYNVDVLGGKVRTNELGIMRNAELNTHRALLLSDGAACDIGLFDASSVLEAFDESKLVYLKKIKSDGRYFDGYITEYDDYEDISSAVFYAFANSRLGAVSVPVLIGTETYMNNSYGAELFLCNDLTESQAEEFTDLLITAAEEYAREVLGKSFGQSIRIYRIGKNIHLTASVT